MDQEKLHRFATNRMTDEGEIKEVLDWIESDEANRDEYNRIKNLWSYLDFMSFSEVDSHNKDRRSRIRYFYSSGLLKYAAIIILAFIAGGYLASSFQVGFFADKLTYNEVIVPRGESAEVVLADQTRVWLNSGATLKYPTHFGEDQRDVELTGEAYFDVQQDRQKPFFVNTSNVRVNVLGTSFNVEAFSDANTVNVTLVEGRVKLETPEGELLSELKPTERASYNISKKEVHVTNVDTKLYTSWKEGIIYFKNESLGTIARQLEQWYNLEIVFEEPSLKEQKYTGTILKNKPVDQILDILKFTIDVTYEMEIRNLKPNVVYVKKDVPMEQGLNK